jgi:hypothetical protein
MSVGCIVAAVIGAFFAAGVVVLVLVVGAGYLYTRRSVPAAPKPVASGPAAEPAPSSGGTADRPSPTPEQQRALEGGKTIAWADQGLSWTVPANWNTQQNVREIFSVKSPGSFDAGWLTVTVSPMPDSFPTDTSIDAMYQQALDQKKAGKYTEVRWLELDGVRGVQFAEAPPEDPGGVQRVQWQAYRTYNGQKELVNQMVHSSGKGFPEHADTLYAILYSTKVSK